MYKNNRVVYKSKSESKTMITWMVGALIGHGVLSLVTYFLLKWGF